jgi:hypothetical protein
MTPDSDDISGRDVTCAFTGMGLVLLAALIVTVLS